MLNKFRYHHLLTLLETFNPEKGALDRFTQNYFRSNKAIGSKDRRYISDTLYQIIRHKPLIDAHLENPTEAKRLDLWVHESAEKLRRKKGLTPSQTCSCPEELFALLEEDLGLEEASRVANWFNTPAPITLRANPDKISRDELIDLLPEALKATPGLLTPFSILCHKRTALLSTAEFKQGYFELQDEASQLVSEKLDLQPGSTVIDYCAGSGGKTLAFAHKLKGTGQIYLHDVRHHSLSEAKQRLKRAGVQNFQLLPPEHPNIEKLRQKADWVLVDAPCTGSGALRRSPDMKEKIDRQWLKKHIGLQREIFESALEYVKPSGHITYATCSLFKDENEHQAEEFLRKFSLEPVGSPLKIYPENGGPDILYSMTFKRL